MTKYMLKSYISTITDLNLKRNLENETILFSVSQSFYMNEGKINNQFFTDIDKIVENNYEKNIIILFDELDAFIAARDISRQLSDTPVPSTLAAIDKSHNLPYSLIGTTNYNKIEIKEEIPIEVADNSDLFNQYIVEAKKSRNGHKMGFIDPAIVRQGRFQHLIVSSPTESQINKFLDQKIINNNSIKKILPPTIGDKIKVQDKYINELKLNIKELITKNTNLTIGAVAEMIEQNKSY